MQERSLLVKRGKSGSQNNNFSGLGIDGRTASRY